MGKSLSLATGRCQNSTSAGPGSWEFVLTLDVVQQQNLVSPSFGKPQTSAVPRAVGRRLSRLMVFLYPPVMALQLQGLELGGLCLGLPVFTLAGNSPEPVGYC